MVDVVSDGLLMQVIRMCGGVGVIVHAATVLSEWFRVWWCVVVGVMHGVLCMRWVVGR